MDVLMRRRIRNSDGKEQELDRIVSDEYWTKNEKALLKEGWRKLTVDDIYKDYMILTPKTRSTN